MRPLIKKHVSTAYAAVFLLTVCGLGIASFARLVNYYDTGIIKNNEWTLELGSKLETDIATTFLGKLSFVNLNGAMRNFLGSREMNGVVKLDNGYLLMPFAYKDDEELQCKADNIISLKSYLDDRGIVFLYVISPYASGKYNPLIPAGVADYGNDNLDRFSAMLQERGIDVLDIRETMYNEGIDSYDMMYRTDHHWTTRAGFYAYSKINDILMKKLDCEVDVRVMDLSNYDVTVYPRWHLGSFGQRTGAYFAGVDDFELILPKFETSVSNITDGSTGTFEETVIRKGALERRNYTSRYTYDSVLWNTLDHFKNAKSMNDKKILMVTDSYGRAVNPFLTLSYGEVRSGRADYETIKEYAPDAVVVLSYVNNTLWEYKYDYWEWADGYRRDVQ